MWPFNKKHKETDSLFAIEFYPETNKYFPKFGGHYLSSNMDTGYITLKSRLQDVYSWDIKYSREDAMKVIVKYKEQRFKINVQTEIVY